jgi:hypothetical protein
MTRTLVLGQNGETVPYVLVFELTGVGQETTALVPRGPGGAGSLAWVVVAAVGIPLTFRRRSRGRPLVLAVACLLVLGLTFLGCNGGGGGGGDKDTPVELERGIQVGLTELKIVDSSGNTVTVQGVPLTAWAFDA